LSKLRRKREIKLSKTVGNERKSKRMLLLEKLISRDFHITGEGRWGSTEEHDSLVIDRERELFFWNSREIYGNVIDWLTKVKHYSYADAINSLGDEAKRTVLPKITKEEEPVVPELVNIFWEDGKSNRKYWYDRELNDESIDSFQLGYHNGWYTLPVFFDSELRNFQMRRDEPSKRILPYYRGKGPQLFNSSILSYVDEVAITEGPIDAILLTQEGYPTVSHTGGSHGWRKEWFKHFINQKQVYVIADNDKAGISGAKKIANSLGQYKAKVVIFEDKPDRYDTVDFFRDGETLDKLKEMMYNRSKYVFELG
jgi:DNA primase